MASKPKRSISKIGENDTQSVILNHVPLVIFNLVTTVNQTNLIVFCEIMYFVHSFERVSLDVFLELYWWFAFSGSLSIWGVGGTERGPAGRSGKQFLNRAFLPPWPRSAIGA